VESVAAVLRLDDDERNHLDRSLTELTPRIPASASPADQPPTNVPGQYI
jgi:hypothetical protein